MSYIKGAYAKASCALIAELRRRGIVSEVGYDGNSRKRNRTLLAYVREENVFKVPREWRGFKVTVHVNNKLNSAVSGDNDHTKTASLFP